MGTGDFLFIWRHTDGSIVTFSPNGRASTDPEKATWLNAMNHLSSSVPTIAPIVRIWIAEECQLIEGRGLICNPFHINHFSLRSIVHGLAEVGGNPGLHMFDHETHHFGQKGLQKKPRTATEQDSQSPLDHFRYRAYSQTHRAGCY
jgi:hypothetical protein